MNRRLNSLLMLLIVTITSCNKDWLEAKSDITQTVPSTLKDLQLLLDNPDVFNQNTPALGEIGADNYYVFTTNYENLDNIERKLYVWDSKVFDGAPYILDWDDTYRQVYYCNVVLETLEKIDGTSGNQAEINSIKGSALFYRSFAFYELASVFAKPFTSQSADLDLGIPLKLSSDINEPSVRATVSQTYNQIINDLKTSIQLLPNNSLYKTRPSKAAPYAMLARLYLSIEDYGNSLLYADSALSLNNALMEYGNDPEVTISSLTPFKIFNKEVIFNNIMSANWLILRTNYAIVDSTLYKSYADNDLRKSAFFRIRQGRLVFKGSYHENSVLLFNGLATDELYLIRAECKARNGNTGEAMDALNALLKTRWNGIFTPMTASDSNDALTKVLLERRKELCFRGLRWTDLRRLNKDNRFSTTLIRDVTNQTFTLPPNDAKYVYPIPPNVIQLTNMPQNER